MPRKKRTTQDRLVTAAGGKSARPAPSGSIEEMIRALAHHTDADAAAALIREQAGHLYDAEHGRQHAQLELEVEAVEGRYQQSDSRLRALDAKCANTTRDMRTSARHLPSADSVARGEKNEGEGGAPPPDLAIPYTRWALRDQISFIMISIGLVLALGMGGANVYANLMASGQPVFIEQPILAVFLSGLLPAGSTALKFISGFFEYSRTKKRYALIVYILTAIVLLAWCIAFSLNFTGVAGGFDWDTVGKSDGKGPVLVGLQLSAELLVAAALFLAAEDISLRYAPHSFVASPEYLNASRALAAHEKTHKVLADRRSALVGQLRALDAAREAVINQHLTAYIALRSRVTQGL
ncbi:MAG: hypothetical protein AAF184_16255 [Pseudomonadota bacterium]